MVALHSLTAASTLLQQIAGSTASGTAKSDAASSVTKTVAGVSSATGSATKSASSTIFNAVAASSEKQDSAVKAMLDFIDRDYTNVEKRDANILKDIGDRPSVQAAYAQHKAGGALLKQQILADPTKAYQMLEQIKAGRPDISQEHAIGLLFAKMGNLYGKAAKAG